MKTTVVEFCPNCETENEMQWDIDSMGYEAYCPVCGEPMMLCDECNHAEDEHAGQCDWNKTGDGKCFRCKKEERAMKIYTVNDFDHLKDYEKEIVAEGRTYGEINYSSILTKLIQECGRLCERYASDLFIDWRSIEGKLKDGTMGTSTYLFGIREDGVDHTEFVLSRYNNCYGNTARYEYRKIYRLKISVRDDGYIRMKLNEIYRP